MAETRVTPSKEVFVNCPFDPSYKPIFDAIIFCVSAAGFQPRCSLECDDASEIRISKILRMIGECPYGIHDISFSQLDPSSGLPRFNMPFELGIFLGCKAFGSKIQKAKIALVLDREPYRYQKSLSDLSGMDIKYHANDPKQAVGAVRQWIRVMSRRQDIPGPDSIWRLYEHFTRALPRICRIQRIRPEELTFVDYADIVNRWLRESKRSRTASITK